MPANTRGLVYLWPDAAARRRQPPLVLRLIVAHGGKHPVYLVTSVLGAKRLSEADAVKIYGLRWGIELFYRHCKQTFERGKLRSRNPENTLLELHWSLLGMWALGLHSHHHLLQRGIPPRRASFAGVLRADRRAMREYWNRPEPRERLPAMLSRAIVDNYHRTNKASRDYPRKKHPTAAGSPQLLAANQQQIQQAKQVKQESKLRLTA